MKITVLESDLFMWGAALAYMGSSGCNNCEVCDKFVSHLSKMATVLKECPQFYFEMRALLETGATEYVKDAERVKMMCDNAVKLLDVISTNTLDEVKVKAMSNLYDVMGNAALAVVKKQIEEKITLVDDDDNDEVLVHALVESIADTISAYDDPTRLYAPVAEA